MNKTPRPKTLQGNTHKVKTGCGNLYVTITYHEGKVFELFAHLGKTGGCAAAQTEAMCRCISLGLRSGVEPQQFVRQLRGIKCPAQLPDVGSCADALSQVIAKEEELSEKQINKQEVTQGGEEAGSQVIQD